MTCSLPSWQIQCTLCLVPGAGGVGSLPLPFLMVRSFVTDGGHGNQTVGQPKPVHVESNVQQALMDMHCMKFRSSAELEIEDGTCHRRSNMFSGTCRIGEVLGLLTTSTVALPSIFSCPLLSSLLSLSFLSLSPLLCCCCVHLFVRFCGQSNRRASC